MSKITKTIVDKLEAGQTAWDGDVKGFGCRCQKKAKAYILKYRFHGKTRWYTIGKHGSPWTPITAKREAIKLMALIADGVDPAKDKAALNNRPTMADLATRYIEEYANEHKKASSIRMDKANIENHVVPLLGKEFASDITREDIDKFKRDVKDGKTARGYKNKQIGGSTVQGGPGAANRCLALLSKMFNMAERWGIRPDGSNPCRHVDKYKEKKVERFLSAEELSTLAGILNELEHDGSEGVYQIAAIRLLIFTGCRLGEILSLKWEYVDFDRGMLLLPDSKTGKKAVFLSAPAQELLSLLPQTAGNPYVICGNVEGEHLVNLQKPWRRIRKRAGLDDVRIHDLRHSFASVAASGGLSLPVIGKLLGHAQSSTTERYAHLAADPLKDANEAIGQRLDAMMKGEGANVVDFKKRN